MTKNTEYELTLFEIIKLLRHKWKLICIITLVFIVLCGGYELASGSDNTQDIQSNTDYKKDSSLYEYLLKGEDNLSEFLKNEWKYNSYDRLNNPIFTISPYNCKYEQIVIRFGDNSNNHYWTVNNWVFRTDDKELFGDQEERLSAFKSSLILIGSNEDQEEAAVQVLSVKGFDNQNAASYLIKEFKKFAAEDGLTIEEISKTSVQGYNKFVDNYQQKNRETYNSISATFTSSTNMRGNLDKPANPEEVQKAAKKDVIKYCLVGFVLGLALGIAFVIFNAIRRREIISAQQVEKSFDLELLGEFSTGSEASLDVLNANLDVMTEEQSNIAVVVEETISDIDEITSGWNKKSDRTFIACTDIFDNPKSIEALKTARGIVIGIEMGKSKVDHVQRILLRANKLNLNVLGYVLL